MRRLPTTRARGRPLGPDTDLNGLLIVIAGVGLAPGSPARGIRLSDHDAGALLQLVGRERLTGHLVAALHTGEVHASTDIRDASSALHRRVTWRVLQLEQVLLRVVDLLTAAGIDVRVLKGPALARTVYDDPSMRTFVDVDILVRSSDIDEATSLLTAAGYRRRLPELRAGFDRRFAKSVTFVDAAGCEVDLHRTLVVGPYGLLVPTDELFDSHQFVQIAGRPLPALAMPEQFLHLCYHASLGDVPPRPASLRDVAETLATGSLELEPVLQAAARWNGEAVVSRAVRLASAAFTVAPSALVDWAHRYQPNRREERLLACYVSPHRSNSRKYLLSLLVIHGLRRKAAYLVALLCPQRQFLDLRHRGRYGWIVHGVVSLVRVTRLRRSGAQRP